MEGRASEASPRERVAALPSRRGVRWERLANVGPSGRSLAIGCALIAAAALAYVVARETPLFALRTVTVKGASPDVTAQVRAALAPLAGSSLVTLDGADVVRRVEGLPTVVSARYNRSFPHGLVVVVRPEHPVAVLRQGSDSWLVSARGRVMKRLPRGAERGLPRIWLGRTTAVAVGARLAGPILPETAALAIAARSALDGRVMTAKAVDGRLTFVLRSGLELSLGRPVAVALKLAVADRVLAAARQASAGGYLDVSVPGRPVGRFNPQPATLG